MPRVRRNNIIEDTMPLHPMPIQKISLDIQKFSGNNSFQIDKWLSLFNQQANNFGLDDNWKTNNIGCYLLDEAQLVSWRNLGRSFYLGRDM